MNILLHWIDTPYAKALGWTLFHFLWEGAVVALFLAVVLLCCRRGPARVRYALACTALFAMPLIFAATFALALPAPASIVVVRGVGLSNLPPGAVAPTPEPLAPESLRDRLRWAVPFWMAGVLLWYAHCLAGWMGVRRLERRGVCAPSAEWQERLRQLTARLRVTRPVVLLESALAEVPLVVGFARPVILMPVGLLAGLRTDQVEAILIHELAHIRRADYIVNLLQTAVEGLLFYHPALWWISGQVRAERENCCDDVVLELHGDARGYAETLAHLEEIRVSAALAATDGGLLRRIRRLLRQPEGPRPAAAPMVSAALLLISCIALSAWQPKPAPAPAPPPAPAPRPIQEQAARPEAASPQVSSPYDRWLEQDVAYIITAQERATFQSLTNNRAREAFIIDFWERRDPTPGTPVNEAKEELYRRIAYSNERFPEAGRAGWRSDRGRLYITYGPPDEIEKHPAAPAGSVSEAWLYRHLEGIGDQITIEFVDTGSGEVRLRAGAVHIKPPDGSLPRQVTVEVRDIFPNLLFAEDRRPSIGRAALITIPLETLPAKISARITTETGRVVSVFEETVVDRPYYQKLVPLASGVYKLQVGAWPAGSQPPSPLSAIIFEVK
jgi:GWxTD domain-containing protein